MSASSLAAAVPMSDGAVLLASTERGIRRDEYCEASLADLLVQACGVTVGGFSEAIVGVADEIDLLHQAICVGGMAEHVTLDMLLCRLEHRVRVIAEVQRRIESATMKEDRVTLAQSKAVT